MSHASGSSMVQGASSTVHQDLEKSVPQNAATDHPPIEECTPDTERVYDTGKAAWLTVFGAWMIQFCTYGYVSAFGVYQDYYSRYFLSRETPSSISWIGSIQLFLQYAAGIFVGQAFDAGFFHHMIALGTVLQIFSMFMLSLARQHHYYEFTYEIPCTGILSTSAWNGDRAIAPFPSVFDDPRASLQTSPSFGHRDISIGEHTFASMLAALKRVSIDGDCWDRQGSSIGGIAWPILLNQLSEYISFANAIRVTAAINGVLLLASNMIMKTQSMHQNSIRGKPKFAVIFKDSAYLVSVASDFFPLYVGPPFLSKCIVFNVSEDFYLQLFAVDLGITKSLSFYSIAILNAGSFFGRILPSLLADRIGPYNMLLPSLVVASALAFVMFSLSNFTGVAIFSLFYGFWSGAYVSLVPSLLAQLSVHPGEHGARMGTAFSIVGISVLIGTPIEGGLLHTDDGNLVWYRSTIFCGVRSLHIQWERDT
ncbi:hypothetical protein CVT25_006925 [Psilocybe cyanescens]|uniref:Major facilitator superfamily (MFS) profile domain-containing protein n=1 Tax=Psilocybe cyanescens TaxID=93625 RepID=A0A409X623_PSICY|nr:hypothetical protein CVT25_006925 [Psilocybe cyanescens]